MSIDQLRAMTWQEIEKLLNEGAFKGKKRTKAQQIRDEKRFNR